jgi:nitrate reductase gamma subunit
MGLALLAGLYLLVQRLLSPTLRAMSAPDDYLAILASCGLLALASLRRIGPDDEILLLLYAFLLLIYVPLGKLRHVVFFFVARADYGRRLGYRGVYPPAATGAE